MVITKIIALTDNKDDLKIHYLQLLSMPTLLYLLCHLLCLSQLLHKLSILLLPKHKHIPLFNRDNTCHLLIPPTTLSLFLKS